MMSDQHDDVDEILRRFGYDPNEAGKNTGRVADEAIKKAKLHYELRDLWALVTEQPGITYREIANELDVTLRRSRRLVNILLASGNLTTGPRYSGRTLRATVPMITMKREKSSDEEIQTTIPL